MFIDRYNSGKPVKNQLINIKSFKDNFIKYGITYNKDKKINYLKSLAFPYETVSEITYGNGIESQYAFSPNLVYLTIGDLYNNILKILQGSDLDFLKLSFTEVYMDNNIQVSWYNVPQNYREEVWPKYCKLPTEGLDPNCPRTEFDKIDFMDGLAYITGQVYYANWPMIVGKEGNRKMFLETTWASPFEQTWMSYMFMETRKGNLKPSVLLASPVNHNRIAHYKPEERREN